MDEELRYEDMAPDMKRLVGYETIVRKMLTACREIQDDAIALDERIAEIRKEWRRLDVATA